jgi:hypothetical protein
MMWEVGDKVLKYWTRMSDGRRRIIKGGFLEVDNFNVITFLCLKANPLKSGDAKL